jgi:hypothetical protein
MDWRSRESAVLIFNRVKALSASWPAACAVAALTVSAFVLTSADADTLVVGGCVGGGGAANCVLRVGPAGDPYIRLVPAPETDAEKERSAERDRKWIDRCRPVIAQDHYGVPRYHYAAPGCEFGIIQ